MFNVNLADHSLRSLEDTQFLLSQILHDIISPFSSLSAGLDILPRAQDEIWDLIQQARDQLYTQLTLTRFVFSYGEGSYEEAIQIFLDYVNGWGIEIQGLFPRDVPLKLAVGLGFWVLRQCRPRSETILSCEKPSYLFHLKGNSIKKVTKEDHILQDGAPGQTPQESYAAYLYRLLRVSNKKVAINRTSDSLSLRIIEAAKHS